MHSVVVNFGGAPSAIQVEDTFMIGHVVVGKWENARNILRRPTHRYAFFWDENIMNVYIIETFHTTRGTLLVILNVPDGDGIGHPWPQIPHFPWPLTCTPSLATSVEHQAPSISRTHSWYVTLLKVNGKTHGAFVEGPVIVMHSSE